MQVLPFGEQGGRAARIFVLQTKFLEVGVADFGASVQFIKFFKGGVWHDLLPGFDDLAAYAESGTYMGATVGRVANRIKGAQFTLGGRRYELSRNDGQNCHHGGAVGFDKKFFKVDSRGNMLQLTLISPDGDMGFPGNLHLAVRYKVVGKALTVTYSARSDRDTLWAPTCHTYFNLEGVRADGGLAGNMLKIYASRYTPIGEGLTPTGELAEVAGTPFDFTSFRDITDSIDEKCPQLALAGGYDHNFELRGSHALSAYGKTSGVKLDIFTDMPGLHLYSGNFMRGSARCGELRPRSAFAAEAQFFPDAANISAFERPLLPAGERKTHYIRYIFG